MFYTAYSVPNVVLPFFGGLLADRWGAARCATLCVCCITVGQCVVATGVSIQSVSLIVFGRVLFGIGGESLCVAISALLQQAFVGAEVGLAMGLNLSVSRLGSVINNVVSPYLAFKSGGVVAPFVFGAGLCVLSFLSALALVPMSVSNITTKKTNAKESIATIDVEENSDASVGSAVDLDEDFEPSNKLRTPSSKGKGKGKNKEQKSLTSVFRCCSFGSRFYLMVGSCIVVYGTVLPFNNVASALLIEKFICHGKCCPEHISTKPSLFLEKEKEERDWNTNTVGSIPGTLEAAVIQKFNTAYTKIQSTSTKPIPISILPIANTAANTAAKTAANMAANMAANTAANTAASTDIPTTTMTMTATTTTTTTTLPPTSSSSTHQQCARAVDAEAKASYVMGIPFLVSALLTPFIGLFADRFGGASTLTLTSPVVLCLVHIILMNTSSVPIFPLVLQGVAYSMYAAALWPLIGRAVRKDDVGTAYGVTTALQNIGLATIPPVVAALRVKAGNYDSVESLFLVLSISGVVFGLGLLLVDGTYYNCTLNQPLRLTQEGGGATTYKRDKKKRRLSEYENSIPPDFFDNDRIREEATSLLEAEGGASEQENSMNMEYGFGSNDTMIN